MRRDKALAEAAAKTLAPASRSPTARRPPVPSQYQLTWRNLPRDVKFMAVGLVVILLAGLGFLFVPYRQKPIAPLLGWSEPTSPRKPVPTPSPTPSPESKKKKKKGWLPW
jgi:hypothetical protein